MYENLFVDLGTVSKIICVLFVENSTKAEPPLPLKIPYFGEKCIKTNFAFGPLTFLGG